MFHPIVAAIFDIEMGWGELRFADLIVRLGSATLLGGLLGLERERLERSAGFRTHALVSVASALMMIVSTYGFPATTPEQAAALDPSRIAAQVVSGIGFLGAGVIIFRQNAIRGLTTAASIWAVSGVGLAAGGGLYVAAAAGTGFMLLISAGFRPIERKMFAHHALMHRVVVTSTKSDAVMDEVRQAMAGTQIDLRSMQFDRKDKKGQVLVELTFRVENQEEMLALVTKLQAAPDVVRVGWRRGASLIRRAGMSGIRSDDFHEEEEDEDEMLNGKRP
ncbi:MAG: MgtC/SapB family protein [Thermomicrobiales bacterium]